MTRPAAAAFLLALVALSPAGTAQEAVRFAWDREGYAKLPEAATLARASGKRLLLGLSGSPT